MLSLTLVIFFRVYRLSSKNVMYLKMKRTSVRGISYRN